MKPNFFRPEIFLKLTLKCSDVDDLQWLADEALQLKEMTPKQIIYCRSIDTASGLYRMLAARNNLLDIVEMFHAHLPNDLKDKIVNQFNRGNSNIRILISTVAFGMGIDVKDIQRVVHWGCPETVEEYWQEVGRCARGGGQGEAIMYKTPWSVNKSRTKACMLDLLQSTECIRSKVLNVFKFKNVKIDESFKKHNDRCCNRCEEKKM